MLGAPDLNVITRTPSVQGYSSLVSGFYASATGSHRATGDGQDVLDPRAVRTGVLDQLDTSVLLTVPAYLTTRPGTAAAGKAGGVPRTTGHRPSRRRRAPPGHLVFRGTSRRDPARGAGRGRPPGRGQGHPDRAADLRRHDALVPRGRGRSRPAGDQPAPRADQRRCGRPGGRPAGPAGSRLGHRYRWAGVRGQRAAAGRPDPAAVGICAAATARSRCSWITSPAAPSASRRSPAARPWGRPCGGSPGPRPPRPRRPSSSRMVSGSSARWRPRPGGLPSGIPATAGPPPWPCAGTASSRPLTCQAGRGIVTWSYRPPGFRMGFALSLGATALILLAVISALFVSRSRRRHDPAAAVRKRRPGETAVSQAHR